MWMLPKITYLVCEKLHPHDYGERPMFLEKDSGTY